MYIIELLNIIPGNESLHGHDLSRVCRARWVHSSLASRLCWRVCLCKKKLDSLPTPRNACADGSNVAYGSVHSTSSLPSRLVCPLPSLFPPLLFLLPPPPPPSSPSPNTFCRRIFTQLLPSFLSSRKNSPGVMGQQQQQQQQQERVMGVTDPHKRPETTRSGTEKCIFLRGDRGISALLCAAIAILSDK
jgi:hypothetical protein